MPRYSAGMPVDDLCRACKEVRRHTVIAADANGEILRVVCDFCGSQHNFRGGAARVVETSEGVTRMVATREALPLVSERERSGRRMTNGNDEGDLELLLRRIIREEAGLTPVAPAEKWRGGTMVLRPGKPGLQEKELPIESLFHKVVMIRNRLRVMEQQINASEIPDDQKLKLQGYLTACYGSLTSFNVLFASEADRFRGSGGDD
jgi:hypothetical protein